MKITYDILWVDDEPQNITVLKNNAIMFLDNFGIRPNVALVAAKKCRKSPRKFKTGFRKTQFRFDSRRLSYARNEG